MINIGCDIGKSKFNAYLGGKRYKFGNENKGIEAFVEKCKGKEISRIVFEPTGGYERRLLKKLIASEIPVSVVNPIFVRKFAGAGKDLAKTDKIDCKVLAEYGEKMEPRIYEPKEEFRFELEELVGRRDNLVKILKDEKNRLEKEPEGYILESIKKHVEYLKSEIKEIEAKTASLVEGKAEEIDEALQSEKGIGSQTSAILISLLPELGRVDNRQIAKLVGLAPMANDSGKMLKQRRIRGGRSRVREALYIASISAIGSNPKVKDFYKRLRAQGKPAKIALTAVARKLTVILNSKIRLFYEGKDYF